MDIEVEICRKGFWELLIYQTGANVVLSEHLNGGISMRIKVTQAKTVISSSGNDEQIIRLFCFLQEPYPYLNLSWSVVAYVACCVSTVG
jgi:hypothetical protein